MTEPAAGTEQSTEDTEAQQQLAAAVTGQQSTDTDTTDNGGEKDYKAEADKWKALARKHEGNAKANAEAARKLAEYEDSQKTEAQRLNDQLAAAQVELQGFRVAEVRRQAAQQAGLDADLAQFITETDPEKALEQANVLAQRLKPPAPAAANFQQGARPAAQGPNTNKDDLIRGLAGWR